MRDPEGGGVGAALGQEDVVGEAIGGGAEDFAHFVVADGLVPGLEDFDVDFGGFGSGLEFVADGFDGGVEGGEADAEAFGFGDADAVVVGLAEGGEASEGGGVGLGLGNF